MRRKRSLLVILGAVPLTVGLVAVNSGGGTVVHAFDPTKAPEIQTRLLDATADIELGYNSPASNNATVKNYTPHGTDQCSVNLGNNVKVNQNCLNVSSASLQGRSQAQNETSIAANPNNQKQLLASENDYRRGDGNCGVQYSNDGGKSWQDSTAPTGFVDGTAYGGVAREYFHAAGDTSVAFDSRGNAYLSCQEFMRGIGNPAVTNNPDLSSAFFLYRATQNGGASWSFPGTPIAQSFDSGSGSSPFLDKQLMTIDNHTGSPFRDRIYVTWTTFDANNTAYIYEAYSSDYGRSFSAPVAVNKAADNALCPNNYRFPTPHGNCNENQFSDPFTGSDGNLYVVHNNFNNGVADANDNHNQVLLSESTDGGVTFLPAVQVANYNDLPDCNAYQGTVSNPTPDSYRACVPEKGSQKDSVFRATNYPSGSVNPTNSSQIVVTFGSYINADSNPSNGCTPAGLAGNGDNLYTGVKTAGACANKILVSVSSNHGASFSATGTSPTTTALVSQGSKQAHTDQWWQWSAFNNDGRLVVSYYDRQYGSDETNGNMDVTLSASKDTSHEFTFKQTRATSSSMPLPTEFPNKDGNSVFFGDYTGLAVANDGAHPLWVDTRSVDLFDCGSPGPPSVCTATEPNGRTANDEDIFTATIKLGSEDDSNQQ